MAIPYPNISPIFLSIGPLHFRWYGLMYILGLIGGYLLIRKRAETELGLSADAMISFLIYLMVGVVIGGRLGYVLIYDLPFYLVNPGDLLAYWQGGMSYHGGALGAILGTAVFAYRYKVSALRMFDYIAYCSPIGIGLGRIGNFINAELYGRIADSTLPWAMVFPTGGNFPRHPSQIYEVLGEGLLLFILLWAIQRQRWLPLKTGEVFGSYFILYGVIRFGLEFFREPDAQIGLLSLGLSMGQWLCVGMIGFGILFLGASRLKLLSSFGMKINK